MTLEQQVTSLEISKRLKELGVKQESWWYWCKNKDGAFIESWEYKKRNLTTDIEHLSAFTVAELGEMLPDYTRKLGNLEIGSCKTDHVDMKPNRGGRYGSSWWNISYWTWKNSFTSKHKDLYLERDSKHLIQDSTEANARGKMLIYLLENKLI